MKKKLSAFWMLPLAAVVLLGGCNVTDLQQIGSKGSTLQSATTSTETKPAKKAAKTEETSVGELKSRFVKDKRNG